MTLGPLRPPQYMKIMQAIKYHTSVLKYTLDDLVVLSEAQRRCHLTVEFYVYLIETYAALRDG